MVLAVMIIVLITAIDTAVTIIAVMEGIRKGCGKKKLTKSSLCPTIKIDG